MCYTIHAALPPDGLDGIKADAIYERRLFTEEQLSALRELWRMRAGTIRDAKHKGVEVIQFVERK